MKNFARASLIIAAATAAASSSSAASVWPAPNLHTRTPRDRSPGLDRERMIAAEAKRARRAARNLANAKKGGAA